MIVCICLHFSGSSLHEILRKISRKLGIQIYPFTYSFIFLFFTIYPSINSFIYHSPSIYSPIYPVIYDTYLFQGFALILFWGRFYLPLPYRVPIVGEYFMPFISDLLYRHLCPLLFLFIYA